MVFRRDEALTTGREQAERYLIPKDVSSVERNRLKDVVDDIITRCGPVVEMYPSWHPLVSNHNSRDPVCYPSDECGYKGLDHTICFANGFLTCPYTGNQKAQKVIDSVKALPHNIIYSHVATIEAEEIHESLYAQGTSPVLVTCNWHRGGTMDRTIPKDIAIPLMLENEVPCWRWSSVADTWETMRPYFLGEPCGKRSSIFVNQETGQMMKKTYQALIYSGMYGPIRV